MVVPPPLADLNGSDFPLALLRSAKDAAGKMPGCYKGSIVSQLDGAVLARVYQSP